jgi:hypothetical protein
MCIAVVDDDRGAFVEDGDEKAAAEEEKRQHERRRVACLMFNSLLVRELWRCDDISALVSSATCREGEGVCV